MTATQGAEALVEGKLDEGRWGSVGFRLDDQRAPSACRRAARYMMERFGLTHRFFGELTDDVLIMVSELVTNAQRHAGDAYHSGSFTLWHPNRWLVLTVHDKGTYVPWRETYQSHELAWDADWEGGGRGLALVRGLAERNLGELDWANDGDRRNPGKVARVRMLLPDLVWPHQFEDPFTGRLVSP